MKTTKQRMLNIIAASSITINLVMLGAVGYIATTDSENNRLYSAMRTPVFIYVPKTAESAAAVTAPELSPSK